MNELLETAYNKNLKSPIRKLEKLIISNNIIQSEDTEDKFLKTNKKSIVKYLKDGIIEYGELPDEDNNNLDPEAAEILDLVENGEGKKWNLNPHWLHLFFQREIKIN
jgi:hypothetical protein